MIQSLTYTHSDHYMAFFEMCDVDQEYISTDNYSLSCSPLVVHIPLLWSSYQQKKEAIISVFCMAIKKAMETKCGRKNTDAFLCCQS